MKQIVVSSLVSLLLTTPLFANENHHDHNKPIQSESCKNFGPQTPRDIDSQAGENTTTFRMAPPASNMNLCNIHFHENAEHKSKYFSIYAGKGEHGYGSGYQCNISQNLSRMESMPTKEKICASEHGDLQPGDTIEVHWVYSTCDVQPGPTLGACSSSRCANPELRVETQVFTLVNDSHAINFNNLREAKDLPRNTGFAVEFLGSTTGPKFSEQSCSPYQVTWSVRPRCAKLDINSVGEWCKGNIFNEDHAHGVRQLVTDPKLFFDI